MSAIFDIDARGRIGGFEFANSVIHSVRRFAYEEVQALFDATDGTPHAGIGAAPEIPEALRADIAELRRAARALRAGRFARGALDLDLPETQIVFDEAHRPIDLRRAPHFEAHELIEEFMLAANEAVARELTAHEYPLLYRVHDEPDAAKVAAVAPVLARMGVALRHQDRLDRDELRRALELAREHPAGAIAQRLVLRSLMRAKYQPANIGHFGLARECYCHFTSPIRRYPDLVVHRVLKAWLAGRGPGSIEMNELAERLDGWGRHCSTREERAQHIEWDATAILAMQFMKRHLGSIFDAHISGVAPMGVFVELVDYPVEALVRIGNFDDDYYELDDRRMLWQGRGSGRVLAVGDPLTVMIERIDVLAGQMDCIALRRKGRH
jgi:ribonuclease R